MQVNDTEKKIGIFVGVLTLVAIIWGFIASVREDAYKEGRESLQQEINTLAKEALQNQMNALEDKFTAEIERVEQKEDEKHREIQQKIERGDQVVTDKVYEVKDFALAEIGGNRSDWGVAIKNLEEKTDIKLSFKEDKH